MTGRTHFIIGANVAWLALLFQPMNIWLIPLVAAGGLAGLLPDIDTPASTIHQKSQGLTRILLLHKILRHRGFSHSLLVLPFIALLSFFFISDLSFTAAGLFLGLCQPSSDRRIQPSRLRIFVSQSQKLSSDPQIFMRGYGRLG